MVEHQCVCVCVSPHVESFVDKVLLESASASWSVVFSRGDRIASRRFEFHDMKDGRRMLATSLVVVSVRPLMLREEVEREARGLVTHCCAQPAMASLTAYDKARRRALGSPAEATDHCLCRLLPAAPAYQFASTGFPYFPLQFSAPHPWLRDAQNRY